MLDSKRVGEKGHCRDMVIRYRITTSQKNYSLLKWKIFIEMQLYIVETEQLSKYIH